MTIMFDSHKYAKRLTEAGMSPALADIQSEIAGDIIKELIALDAKVERVKQELEAKIADSRAELIKWVVGIGLLQSSLITALLLRLLH